MDAKTKNQPADLPNVQLAPRDRQAVDVALDPALEPTWGANGSDVAGTSASWIMSDDLSNRVNRVEAWLHLLDHLPADEPPTDLVARTMARVTTASDTTAPATSTVRPGASAVSKPAGLHASENKPL